MAGMRLGVLVVALALVVTLLSGCANPRTEADARLDNTIETLLDAIRTQDDGAILSLEANPPNFGERGRLEDDVAGFLYDGDFVRTYNPDARSVVEIIARGPLRIRIVRQQDGGTTVFFIPEQFKEQARVVSFYSERWMRDYFACEFHLIDGRWVLLYNICFALTDGPYPEPYGWWRGPGYLRLVRAGRAHRP